MSINSFNQPYYQHTDESSVKIFFALSHYIVCNPVESEHNVLSLRQHSSWNLLCCYTDFQKAAVWYFFRKAAIWLKNGEDSLFQFKTGIIQQEIPLSSFQRRISLVHAKLPADIPLLLQTAPAIQMQAQSYWSCRFLKQHIGAGSCCWLDIDLLREVLKEILTSFIKVFF